MCAGKLAVHKNFCAIIHSAEMQHGAALQLFFCDRYSALIPHAVHKIRVLHTGKFAFRAERHGDLSAERCADLL